VADAAATLPSSSAEAKRDLESPAVSTLLLVAEACFVAAAFKPAQTHQGTCHNIKAGLMTPSTAAMKNKQTMCSTHENSHITKQPASVAFVCN
jgi:hypothetical protein